MELESYDSRATTFVSPTSEWETFQCSSLHCFSLNGEMYNKQDVFETFHFALCSHSIR